MGFEPPHKPTPLELIRLGQLAKFKTVQWRKKCQSSLEDWARECVWDYGFKPARHHLFLIKKLEDVIAGKIDRLMIFMPPGSAKSTYTSEILPPYWFKKFPQSSVIGCSHTGELAQRFGRRVRNKILLKKDVLGYTLDDSNMAASRWETENGGEYFAAGVGGAITGRRADLAIIDDPVKSREEAESETVREKTYEWYKSDLVTRLKPNARIILIQTRWHLDDLGGMLLGEMQKGGDQWEVINLPALAVADDPLDPPRKVGEALWPEWEDKEALERKRKIIGFRDFESLYQQNPQPPGGTYFLEADFLVGGAPVQYPTWCNCVYAVLDTGIKTNQKHDASGLIYFAYNAHNLEQPLTILDYDLFQVEVTLLEHKMSEVYQKLEFFSKQCKAIKGSAGIIIEDKGSGTMLLQQLNNRGLLATAVDSKLVQLGKEARCMNISGYTNTGKIKYSETAYKKTIDFKAKHRNHLLAQIHTFMVGVKDQEDDLVDCLCYGVSSSLGDWQHYGGTS